MELLPAYQAPHDTDALDHERERVQVRLDYLHEQGDRPDLFGPNVQDFPPNTTGPLLLPSRSRDCAPPPPSLTGNVAAAEAQAPTNNEQPRRAYAEAA